MVSIIIPVYNLERYLEKCLDSIIVQNNSDFEVLMINDGSTDRSEIICDEYARKDPRFHLFNKSNGGVSSARNLGLAHCKGEWVVFIDGDDVVDSDYITLPDRELDSIDIIEKSYRIIKNGQVLLSNIIKNDESYHTIEELKSFYSDYISRNSATLCNKLIRRERIGDTLFDEKMKMGEDFLFFLGLLSRIREYYRCTEGCYDYIRRDTSASGTIDSDKKQRLNILFENLGNVKRITASTGILDLGIFIIYTIYYPYILRLRDYMTFNQWICFIGLWLKFPFMDNHLMARSEKSLVILGTVKVLIKSLLSRKK